MSFRGTRLTEVEGLTQVDYDKYKRESTILTYNASFDNVNIEKLVNAKITQFSNSRKREWMMDGIRYYNNDSDIRDKQRFGVTVNPDTGSAGSRREYNLSNSKIHRSFMRKLTRQKQNYIFRKQPTIEAEESYRKILEEEYFDKPLYNLLSTLTKQSIKQGINWTRQSYDEFGNLVYDRIPGDQVIPFWVDVEHTKLSELIHFYTLEVLIGEEVKEEHFADYYTDSGVWHLKKGENGEYSIIEEKPYTPGHFYIEVELTEEWVDEVTGMKETRVVFDEDNNPVMEKLWFVWDRIPWIAWKNNSEEHSLLKYIKSLNDEYEEILSITTDIIKDIPDAIKVIKNYNGQGENLQEILEMIQRYRIALVDDEGGIDALETPFQIEASDKTLTRLRRDLFEDGGGVDVQNVQLGDKSGVAIKFLYEDLDLDCVEIVNQLRTSLEQLLFFINHDILIKKGLDFFDYEVTFNFNMEGINDDDSLIGQINDSRGFVPDELLLPRHPFVDDVEQAKELMEEQKRKQEEELMRTLHQDNQFQLSDEGTNTTSEEE